MSPDCSHGLVNTETRWTPISRFLLDLLLRLLNSFSQ